MNYILKNSNLEPRMTEQYQNLVKYSLLSNFKLLTTCNEFVIAKQMATNKNKTSFQINFECIDNKHKFSLNFQSYMNKRKTIKCKSCVRIEKDKQLFPKIQKEMWNKYHVKIVSYDSKTRKCQYKCKSCLEIKNNFLKNLKKESCKHTCVQCSQKNNRNDIEEVRSKVENLGFKLLTTGDQYKTNKEIDVICVCGKEWKTSISNITRGRKCLSCKVERTIETNLERYGVENVFQSEEIKEKSKNTCVEKYGVTHPMKNAEILEKAKQTCLERYGKKFAFNQDYVYEKIRKTHKEKYGVEFPLQSIEIQVKIEATFLEKYGVKRPILSAYFRQLMLERYGNEVYVLTDDYKEKMLDKYGVIYPTQNPDIFEKACMSRRNIKTYNYKDFEWKVMGYEPFCLQFLIEEMKILPENIIAGSKDIPRFKYMCQKSSCNLCNNYDGHIYFPDIYVKCLELVIEVKSSWTLLGDYQKNCAKFKHCWDVCDFQVFVFDKKGELEDVLYNFEDMEKFRLKNM